MSFPAHWWQAIIDPEAPEWEILPQAAAPGQVILSKRNELGLLSNLAATPFTMDGTPFASVESLWQMTKLPENPQDARAQIQWPCTREDLRQLSGLPAKRLGDQISVLMKENGIAWVSYQENQMPYPETAPGPFYRLIRRAMREKALQNPAVLEVLCKTGDLILRPDHHVPGPLSPAHRYDEIWMELRKELCSPG